MEQQAKQIENGTSTESLEQVEKKLNEILLTEEEKRKSKELSKEKQ